MKISKDIHKRNQKERIRKKMLKVYAIFPPGVIFVAACWKQAVYSLSSELNEERGSKPVQSAGNTETKVP